jgi:Ca-activated chloride channel family protein
MKSLSLIVTAAMPLLLSIACNNQRLGKSAHYTAPAVVKDEQLSEKVPPPQEEDKEAFKLTTITRQRAPMSEPAPPQMNAKRRASSADSSRLDGEGYAPIEENRFLAAKQNPLSTFSIDVDAASYSNVRRLLREGVIPPPGAIRIEELINYFDYQYPQPKGDDPFSVNTEMAACPWNPAHRLMLVGLQGKVMPEEKLPAANLVFLIDVSGSMDEPDKLPLVKTSLKMLINQLRDNDRVAIVVYAGNAGLVLPSTAGTEKQKIRDAVDNLEAGGSTAGGAGLELAYKVAAENFIKGGNNRIVLSTDGDFNVGPSSDDALVALVEKERQSGIFLSVLGYGEGNYQDAKMQQLADKGNGNHFYIDNSTEAQRVLVKEFGGTLFTIAKDVKIQVEFNPAAVSAYRLIGYENRMLAAEDFNDDRMDAGELGSGHRVTALYELIPAGVSDEFTPSIDELRYQPKKDVVNGTGTDEWMTIKLRYKQPDGDVSRLISETAGKDFEQVERASDNLRFAAAVAEFGMLLRNSAFREKSSWVQVSNLAKSAFDHDPEGYRHEFVGLAETAASLSVTKR